MARRMCSQHDIAENIRLHFGQVSLEEDEYAWMF
jgi:hypothetical protein